MLNLNQQYQYDLIILKNIILNFLHWKGLEVMTLNSSEHT